MNKELIIKYNEEFNHWIEGGTLQCIFHNDTEPSWEVCTDDELNRIFGNNEADLEVSIVINDAYVKFRKAITEGKTVQYNPITQYNNRWDDIPNIDPNVHDTIKNYRIKPDEPKFKVGDLVEVLYTNNPKLIGVVEKLDISQAFIEWGNGRSWKSFDKLAFWQPKEDEWVCSIKDTDSFEVYKYKSHPNPKPCQPFLGTLPFNLKEFYENVTWT